MVIMLACQAKYRSSILRSRTYLKVTLLEQEEVVRQVSNIHKRIDDLKAKEKKIRSKIKGLHSNLEHVRRCCPHPYQYIETCMTPGKPTFDVCKLCGQEFP